MNKNNSFKLVELMSCAISLGIPMFTSGIVSANTNTPTSSSISQNETKFVFNPNDSLTKQALNKAYQGIIKNVTLVTIENGKENDTPMTKQSDGSYTATLNGNSKDIKYQYKVDFQDGKSVTINDPRLDNSSNDQYSEIGNKPASSKTNITITTPDGTVIDISGQYNKNNSNEDESLTASLSVVSSSKIESSQSNEKNQTTSSSNSKKDGSSIEKEKSESSELLKSKKSSIKDSSSVLTNSSQNDSFEEDKEMAKTSLEKGTNNQAAVVANGQKETDNSGKTNNQTPDVTALPETNKENNNQEANNQPAKTQAAVTDKDSSKSSSQSSSTLSSSNQSSNSNESSKADNANAQSMPQTGEMIIRGLSILGIMLLVGVGGYYGFQNYKNRKNSK